MWWADKCSITEYLPELIQQVKQDLAGAPGAELYIICQPDHSSSGPSPNYIVGAQFVSVAAQSR